MQQEQEDENEAKMAQDLKILKSHLAQLLEHFETVQLFVTRHVDDGETGTTNASFGAGNWFARYGQIRYWLMQQELSGE